MRPCFYVIIRKMNTFYWDVIFILRNYKCFDKIIHRVLCKCGEIGKFKNVDNLISMFKA